VTRWRIFVGFIVALLALGSCTSPQAAAVTEVTGTAVETFQETARVLEFSRLTPTEIIARNAAVKVVDPFDGGHGSGTYMMMYGRYVVVTAAHVVENLTTMFIEARDEEVVVGTIVYRDLDADLAILIVPQIHSRIAAPWHPYKDNRNILGASITYTGFPGNHDLLTIRGHVAALEHDMIVTNMFGWFGASGAGAFDQHGRFMGVVTGIDIGNSQRRLLSNIVWISPIWFLDKDVVKARVKTAEMVGVIKAMPGASAPRRGGLHN